MAVELTDPMLKALKPGATATTVHDTEVTGLGLTITPHGVKTWSVRYRVGRRLRRLTLGRYPRPLSLAAARKVATTELKKVIAGGDPAAEKRAKREADTVGGFAETYIKKFAKPNKKSWKDDDRLLRVEILPTWKHRALKEITRRDTRELLDAIAERPAPILANRVRSLLHKLFNVAIERDVVDTNPVSATKKPSREHARDRVLSHDEIRTFWEACEALDAPMAAFYRLRLLTAQRGGEVASMSWADLDLVNGWWTIPATSSKNKLAHRVPLNTSALALITALRANVDQDLAARRDAGKDATEPTYVLAHARGKRQQAKAAATFQIPDFRGHDLRRTAASLMAGSGVDRLVISKILNHVEKGVTAVYDRHGYDSEKRTALDTWDRTLTGILEKKSGDVLPFGRKGKGA